MYLPFPFTISYVFRTSHSYIGSVFICYHFISTRRDPFNISCSTSLLEKFFYFSLQKINESFRDLLSLCGIVLSFKNIVPLTFDLFCSQEVCNYVFLCKECIFFFLSLFFLFIINFYSFDLFFFPLTFWSFY